MRHEDENQLKIHSMVWQMRNERHWW